MYFIGEPKLDNTSKKPKYYCVIQTMNNQDQKYPIKTIFGGSPDIAKRNAERYIKKRIKQNDR
jgi:hypothetical protein